MAKKKELKFEDALNKLESIADELSRGDIELDEALSKYEEGARLLSYCHESLSKAEKKIKLVIKKNKDAFKLEDFRNGTYEDDTDETEDSAKDEPENSFLI